MSGTCPDCLLPVAMGCSCNAGPGATEILIRRDERARIAAEVRRRMEVTMYVGHETKEHVRQSVLESLLDWIEGGGT